MSLETVVDDIREEAEREAAEIREEAEREAAEIREEAEREAAEIREEAEREAEREIDQERERTLSSAKLEAKQRRLAARREALGTVREAVEAAIADVDGDRREKLTRALVDATTEEFGDADAVRVYGRADDEPLLREVLADYDGYEWAGARDCLGGVIVESDESRVRVNNTFDSVLEEVWDENLRAISERLFEER